MGNFDRAINVIRKHEGGYVNHEKDPGGATHYGISLRFLKGLGFLGNADINNDGCIDVADIQALTEEQANEFYKREFWDRYHYDKIDNNAVATKVFDIAVNAGPATAARVVQKSINVLQGDACLKVDGVLGEKSFHYMNECEPFDLLQEIVKHQKAYYQSLCENNHTLKVFLKGWLTRAEQI